MGGATGPSAIVPGPARLLERDAELAVIERAVSGALTGAASLVVVEGPAGIGKSQLVAAARAIATQRDVTVLSARASELEHEFPFGVVRQLFEPRLADPEIRANLLGGAAAAAAPVFNLPGTGIDYSTTESTFAALHGLYWLTVNLSGDGPVLLAIDDLQWADRASLRFLGYLARRLEGLSIAVIAGLRPAEGAAQDQLVSELTTDPNVVRLAPRPLSAEATTALVRRRLGGAVEAEFARACRDATRGNPLLLDELLKTLGSEGVEPTAANVGVLADLGPRAVSRAVLLRLARLTAEAVRVARALAILGDGAQTPVIGEMAGLDGEAVAGAARELVQAEIARSEPTFGFVHPLVQAAVARDLAPAERELSHERAARILLDHGAPAEQVASHLLAVPRHTEPWVVDVLRRAAHDAFAKGAPDAAIAALRRALAEPLADDLRAELLFELGRAQALMSLPDSAGALREAFDRASDPAVRAHAADWLACTLNYLEAPDEAADIARRSAAELPADLADLGRQLESSEHISLFFGARDGDGTRVARLRSYRTIDPSLGPGARMLAAVAAWEWAESAGPAGDVAALARSALADGGLVSADAGYVVVAAILPLALADLDEAVDQWEAVRAEAHRSGYVFTLLAAQLWGGYTRHLRGELPEAEADLRAALETAGQWGVPSQLPWTTPLLAEVLLERGAIAEARSILDGTAPPRQGSDPAVLLARASARVLLAEGRADEALVHADALREAAGWRRHPRYAPWRSLKAQALDLLGRSGEAASLAAEELEIARAWGSPATVGRSLRVLGAIEREAGLPRLEEACALLEAAPARLEHAKALAALGETLRRARRPAEARGPLRRALELAEACGATALVDRARAEIYATGARPRTTALRGVRSLTSSERRVADLAVEGRSNRDIAQALYVTPKTVEVHLGAVYRKLGISSRRALADALADGLPSPRQDGRPPTRRG